MTGIPTLRLRISDAIAAGYERGVDDAARRARVVLHESFDALVGQEPDIAEKCRMMMVLLRFIDIAAPRLRERPDPAADYAHRQWVDRQLERGDW